MEEDISKKSITVLVVLTVLISVLGTLSVMNAVNEFKAVPTEGKSSTEGKVTLTITDAEEGPKGISAATGQIVMEVLPPEEPEQPKILLLPENT